MRLTLSVLDRRGTGRPVHHVTVDAAPGTTFGEVRSRLAALAGVSPDDLEVGGRRVEDQDPLGRPPLLHGTLLVAGASATDGDTAAGAGAVELRVVAGLGAGRVVVLGRGEHVVGRAPSARLRLDDPGVSRAHAVLTVSSQGIHLRDLEPTNPSRVDGSPLPAQGAQLIAGQLVRMGSTALIVGPAHVRSGRHELVDGEVRIHRRPRLRQRSDAVPVVIPQTPRRPEHGRLPLLASLAPLVLSAVLALVLSSPGLLLFALMSPVLLLGQWWSDRRAGRTSYRRQLAEHAAELAGAQADLRQAVQADAARRRSEQPDLGYVEAVVHRRGTRLWERRPTDDDHLLLRVGTATQPAAVSTEGPAPEPPQVDDLPALVDLARAGVVGVAGPRGHATSLAGALLLQLAAWHTPRTVSLHVLVDTEIRGRDWEWAAYLPHLAGGPDHRARVFAGARAVGAQVAALLTLVESRRDASDGSHPHDTGRRAPDVVVLVDGASALRAVPGVSELLRQGPRAGVAVVCLDVDAVSLPAEARAYVELDAAGLEATIREDGRTLEGVTPDLPSRGWLESVARAMAPYVDATPEEGSSPLRDRVSFLDLHRSAGTDPASADDLVAAWQSGGGRPVALVGLATEGPVLLDLAADGPHALVGGTTGSGKSELLQTLVAGLAVTNPPDRLGFVLVDYKGGSAFSECARLPHTVGLVTDLDAHETSRALTSLDAELKRRERLLAQAGARDLDEYRRAADVCRDLPPLARLVVVVDEFKALAEEFPDFVDGLVRVAALGRSLGLHLVLATQRPAGIVSADMRANIGLRIALRVRDRSDSEDVVDCADAAALDPRTPGRACLRAGDNALRTVQTAYLGGVSRPQGSVRGAPTVVARDLLPGMPSRPDGGHVEGAQAPSREGRERAVDGLGGTELHAVVEAACAAAGRLGSRPDPQPWLPALPGLLRSADLSGSAAQRLPGDGAAAVIGLVDLPHEQRQDPFVWHPRLDGHLGVAGGPRSGRSTTLVTVALDLARRHGPDELHLHVMQGLPGPAAALARLPHVGTITDSSDPGVTRRLVARLLELVDGQRDRHLEGQHEGLPSVVVLVDGWESVEEALTAVDHGVTVDELHRLLRDGPSAGVWFAVGGGRALLSGRLPGLLRRRLVLAMPDPLDLTLAGVAAGPASTRLPSGRAIDLRSGDQVQLAVPGNDASSAATTAAVGDVGSRWRQERRGDGAGGSRHVRAPIRIRALPVHVDLDGAPPQPDRLVLGLGGDEAEPVGLSLGPGHRRLLVAGVARSGRSTTLTTIGERLVQQGRHVVAICPRRSPLLTWAAARAVRVLAPQDATELITLRRDDPDLCLLVDDAELVDGSPVEIPLVEATRLLDETDGVVAVAAELARANGAFRGLVPEVARDGCGLVLGASTPGDGDVLGVRLQPSTVRRAGRAHVVVDGRSVPAQVARLEPGRPLPPLVPVPDRSPEPPATPFGPGCPESGTP